MLRFARGRAAVAFSHAPARPMKSVERVAEAWTAGGTRLELIEDWTRPNADYP